MDPNHFPSRLHEMLREIDDAGNGTGKIVSWQPHGKCFMIRDKEQFITRVLPK
jgi:HSF-type DNA-binding